MKFRCAWLKSQGISNMEMSSKKEQCSFQIESLQGSFLSFGKLLFFHCV